MNNLIKTIFTNFTVDGVLIPVKFLHYYGHGEPYVVYQKESMNKGLSADNGLQNYIEYYDFDVYSKNNYKNIVESVKNLLISNNFFFEPDRSSGDMFEKDTGYYHDLVSPKQSCQNLKPYKFYELTLHFIFSYSILRQ